MMNVYVMPGFGARGSGLGVSEARGPSPEPLYLLDLPGYGFARASQADRLAFRLLITHTLARPGLTGVLWLLDIRHEPSADDRIVHEQFAGRETPILAAFTKADKLSRRERLSRARELRETLALDDDQVIVTSARKNEGIEELRESIKRFVG